MTDSRQMRTFDVKWRCALLTCGFIALPGLGSAQLAQTGDLLVADAGADAVFVVDRNTGNQSVLASGPPLSDPSGIAVDPTTGLIYVSDRSAGPGGTGALIEIAPSDGSMRIASSGDQLVLPEDVIVNGTSGQISIVDGLSGNITIDPVTGVQTILSPQIGSAITRLALFGAQRAADAIVIDPGPLELRRLICSISPCNLLLVGQAGNFQLPTGITTRGALADFTIVSDAGSLNSADGAIIEVRITNFSALNPDANQRVIASGINLVDPLDLVTDAAGVFVYVVDPAAASGAGAVIRVDVLAGDQVVLSSGASFVNPVAIELFPPVNSTRIFSDLFGVDSAAAEVFQIDRVDGSQTTVSTGGMLVEPSGVFAVPGTSDLLVTDRRGSGSGSVLRIDAGTGSQSLISEGGNLQNPEDLVLLPDGNLLVADSLATSLIRIDVGTGQQTNIAGTPTELVGITVTGDGSVYGLHLNPPELSRIDLGGGGTQIVGSAGDLTNPVDLLAETNGSLLVLNGDGTIVRILPDAYDNGAPASNQTVVASGQELVSPTGFGIAPDNALFVTDPGAASGTGAVIMLFAGGAQTVLSSGGQFVSPADIASTRPIPRPGDILVVDQRSLALVLVDPTSGDQRTISAVGLMRTPDGIALDQDGSLLVAEAQNDLLLRINLETGAQTIVASGPDLPQPRSVAVRSDGAIFVGNGTSPFPIVRVDPSTGDTTVIASNNQNVPGGSVGETRFSGFQKLTTDPDSGDLIVSTNVVGFNVTGDALLRLDPDDLPLPTSPQTIIDGAPLDTANEMVFDPVSGDLFVANGANILRVDPISGNASVVSEGGLLGREDGLAIDAQGQLLATTVFGDAVVRIDPATGDQLLVSFSNLLGQPHGIVVMPVPEPAAPLAAAVALLSVAVVARARRRLQSSCHHDWTARTRVSPGSDRFGNPCPGASMKPRGPRPLHGRSDGSGSRRQKCARDGQPSRNGCRPGARPRAGRRERLGPRFRNRRRGIGRSRNPQPGLRRPCGRR